MFFLQNQDGPQSEHQNLAYSQHLWRGNVGEASPVRITPASPPKERPFNMDLLCILVGFFTATLERGHHVPNVNIIEFADWSKINQTYNMIYILST